MGSPTDIPMALPMACINTPQGTPRTFTFEDFISIFYSLLLLTLELWKSRQYLVCMIHDISFFLVFTTRLFMDN